MLGLECTGDVPFREVHLHGLVRDPERQKMSKTKGNVVDPLELIDRFGTDAVRIALLLSAATGADIALKQDRIEAGQAFANKLWNASRLLFLNMERSGVSSWTHRPLTSTHIEDAWMYRRLNDVTILVNKALKQHRYHEAAHELWHFAWHEFCDWYLEVKKLRFREASGQDEHWTAALTVYETLLRLLHPFMPFLTEELWQRLQTLAAQPHAISISLEHYPAIFEHHAGNEAPFVVLQEIVKDAREKRADLKIDPKTTLDAMLLIKEPTFSPEDLSVISSLAKLRVQQHQSSEVADSFELRINTAGDASSAISLRASKEIPQLQKVIESSKRQLSDPIFLNKAPENVIASLRAKVAEYEAQLAKYKQILEGQ